jgi:phosphonatase-like hydrolase
MSAIRLAVLDMAGTTVRDDGLVERAFHRAMIELGVAPDSPRMHQALAEVRRTMGQSKIEVFGRLLGDRDAAEGANRRFEVAMEDEIGAGAVAPVDGAEEAIHALATAGVRTCLTTGFSPRTRDRLLEELGWAKLVDLALSPADAGRGRPYPDMILTALLRLRIDDVREVAVAGDTASDLLAGTRAGAGMVAGVLTGAHDREQLAAAPHTHLLASVAELPGLLAGPGR